MSLATSAPSSSDSHFARILCLHGGGTNARIFRAQCRVLQQQLGVHFRLIFAEAPIPSPAGPNVESVYGESCWGPFLSWLPLHLAAHEALDDGTIKNINTRLEDAIQEDNKLGSTGRIVGVLGFSQGAKIAGSLLLQCQRQRKDNCCVDKHSGVTELLTDLKFGLLLAGRAPLLSMDTSFGPADGNLGTLALPTVHVHGLYDPGLALHRDLLHNQCDASTARLVEWEGDHRVPIRSGDVAAVVAEVLAVAYGTGALPE